MSDTEANEKKTIPQKVVRFFQLLFSNAPKDRLYLRGRLQQIPVFGKTVAFVLRLKAKLVQTSPADYVRMQKREYETSASLGDVRPGNLVLDNVVGSWRKHDAWPDYEIYLMKYVPKDGSWLALDFGCGPGRNIRRWSSRFKRIDGVDISPRNLENARVFIQDVVPPEKAPNLYVTEGMDCGAAPKGAYDFVFSTICLQHICVHTVRFSILQSLFGCLKPGGRLSIQMGYGVPSSNTVPYHADFVQAVGTNRACDAALASPDELKVDLERIGFKDFEYWLRPVGPSDVHPQWIFATAVKPQITPG